jgi:hypothetical protein
MNYGGSDLEGNIKLGEPVEQLPGPGQQQTQASLPPLYNDH